MTNQFEWLTIVSYTVLIVFWYIFCRPLKFIDRKKFPAFIVLASRACPNFLRNNQRSLQRWTSFILWSLNWGDDSVLTTRASAICQVAFVTVRWAFCFLLASFRPGWSLFFFARWILWLSGELSSRCLGLGDLSFLYEVAFVTVMWAFLASFPRGSPRGSLSSLPGGFCDCQVSYSLGVSD